MTIYDKDEWMEHIGEHGHEELFAYIQEHVRKPSIEAFSSPDMVFLRKHFMKLKSREDDPDPTLIEFDFAHSINEKEQKVDMELVEVIVYDDWEQFNLYKRMAETQVNTSVTPQHN